MNRSVCTFIILTSLVLFSCGGKQESAGTTIASDEFETDTLKSNLKAQICNFLTVDDVKTIAGLDAELESVSGYDGTTGHYCSYNWNKFNNEIKFAYVFSTLGNIEKVSESLSMFQKSDSLEPVKVNVGERAAFWGEGNSRLSVFYDDVQLYIDMRKTDFADKKAIAVKIAEKALE